MRNAGAKQQGRKKVVDEYDNESRGSAVLSEMKKRRKKRKDDEDDLGDNDGDQHGSRKNLLNSKIDDKERPGYSGY